VNGGLARRERRRATVGEHAGRRDESWVGLTAETGEDRHGAQGGERSPSSGRSIASSGDAVAGPGL